MRYFEKLVPVLGNETVVSVSPEILRKAMERVLTNKEERLPRTSGTMPGGITAPRSAGRSRKATWIVLPLEQVPNKKIPKRVGVAFYTVDEARALIRASDDLTRPYYALGLFAGVRPFELHKLRWEQIDLEHDEVVILATVSKTRKPRTIPIADNLKHLLELTPIGQRTGLIAPSTNRRKVLEVPCFSVASRVT